MEVRRITPSPSRFVDILKSFDTRLGQQETKAAGNIVIRETLTTTDPATGVQTVFGQLPNGNHGLQLWVGDTEPPPVPATPVVSSALGTITILWSGSFSGTAVAPPDFDHINAYSQNVTGGPVSLAGSMRNSNDSVIFSGVAIPGDKWVCWLTALDANGNESAASVYSAPITVASVLDDSGLSAKLADNQTQIDQANANIATANTAIATKNTISSQSTAPTGAHSGDYWLDSSNGNKAMYYNGAAWVAVQDAAIGQALTTANGKNTIVSASTAPTGPHTTGDTWFDTSNGNRPNTWNGTAWVSAQDASIATAQSAANSAQTTANGKNTIVSASTAPTGTHTVGDIWFDTSNGNRPNTWNGTAWISAQDAAIAASLYSSFPTDIDTSASNKWLFTKYNKTTSAGTIPSFNLIAGCGGTSSLVPDGTNLVLNIADNYVGQLRTIVTVLSATTVAITATHDDGGQIYVDGVSVYAVGNYSQNVHITFALSVGTHVLDFMWAEQSGGDGWNNITPSISSQVSTMYAPVSLSTTSSVANSAQTSANGKNTTTYSSSAASGTGTATGDLWLQTNGSDVVIGQWQWNGSAWVQQTIDNAVISNLDAGKITVGTLNAARIGAGSIDAGKLVANTITANQIAAQTITSANIATDTITAGNIAAGAITASELAAGSVTAQALTSNSVSATAMVANTITAGQIAAGTITTNEIKANTITASNIAGNTITASQLAANTITAGQIAANTITTNQIAASTITSTNIAASAITADRIAGGTITATQIAVGTITSANIAASAITANKINAGAIDGMVITGAVVRTAASGARIVLDTTSLNAWDGSGVNYLSISQGSVVLQGTAKAIGSVQDGGTNSTTTIAATLGYGFSGTNTGVIGTYAGLGFVNTGVSNENASAVYTTDGQNLNMIAGDIKNTTYPGGGGPARIQLSGTTTTLYSSLSVIAPTSGGVSFQVPSVTMTGSLQVNTIQPTTTSTGITIDAQTYNLHLNGSAVDINHGSGVLTGRYGGGTTAKKLSRGIIANVYFLGVSAFSSTTPSTIINQVMTLEGGTTIRVDFHYAAGANANDLYAAYDILVGSTTIRAYTMAYHISGYGQSCDIWGIYSVPSTGSYNVSITGQVAAGAGTVSTGSSSTSNAPQVHMLVTDLG